MTSLRIIASIKDLQVLTGKSYRQCCRNMSKIKKYLNKEKHHLITIAEVCAYYKIPYEEAVKVLK